jgi:hypothetical protein
MQTLPKPIANPVLKNQLAFKAIAQPILPLSQLFLRLLLQ